MYTFMPSEFCLLRDFVYPMVRHEPNLFPHPLVHQLYYERDLPLDINEMKRRFRILDHHLCDKYYFVMPNGPPVGRENAIQISGSKMFWKSIREWDIVKLGDVYGKASMYRYMREEKATDWNMVIYHVNSSTVRKCGPAILRLSEVELRWKAIKIFPTAAKNALVSNPVPVLLPPPPASTPSISSGMAFVPRDICLLRDFVYPLVRHEPNLFPHPFVHQLHDQRELPLDIDEMRERFQILDHRLCDKYYFVMPEGPPVGRKNAVEIGGSNMFWKKWKMWDIIELGYPYGEASMYECIHGERSIGWYMVIYHVNPSRVLKCGPVELELHQVELQWKAIKIFPKESNDIDVLVFNHVRQSPTPRGDESPPPPPPPLSPLAS